MTFPGSMTKEVEDCTWPERHEICGFNTVTMVANPIQFDRYLRLSSKSQRSAQANFLVVTLLITCHSICTEKVKCMPLSYRDLSFGLLKMKIGPMVAKLGKIC